MNLRNYWNSLENSGFVCKNFEFNLQKSYETVYPYMFSCKRITWKRMFNFFCTQCTQGKGENLENANNRYAHRHITFLSIFVSINRTMDEAVSRLGTNAIKKIVVTWRMSKKRMNFLIMFLEVESNNRTVNIHLRLKLNWKGHLQFINYFWIFSFK